jgi:DNA processing protein
VSDDLTGPAEVPTACDACLPRLHLLGLLAPYIEKIATGEAGSRSPELLALDDETLARAVAGSKAGSLLGLAAGVDPDAIRERIRAADCWAACRHDPGYPEALRDAADAPPVIVGRGDPDRLERLRPETTVTVVGARRATTQGREIARDLAAELAGAGFAVVSGLAWGIDGAAHEGALRSGFTAAVLGCGADVVYPLHHRKLYERLREHGLILSELPPGTGAWRWAFPARNRIMAALGAMTIVVEAAGRSGSLITAELASELGREVGAVPGSITARMSAGTNQLIADGAHLVRDADDVLDALLGPGSRRPAIAGPALDPELAAVLDRVEAGDLGSDSIAVALDCGGDLVTADLSRLELLGYVKRSFTGAYSRTALARPREPTAQSTL